MALGESKSAMRSMGSPSRTLQMSVLCSLCICHSQARFPNEKHATHHADMCTLTL